VKSNRPKEQEARGAKRTERAKQKQEALTEESNIDFQKESHYD
jgi:hypothetical protein